MTNGKNYITRDIVYICDTKFVDEIKGLCSDNGQKQIVEKFEKNYEKINRVSDKFLSNVPIFTKMSKKKNDMIQSIPINYADDYFKHDEIEVKGISNFSIGLILAKHPFFKNTYITIDSLENEILHHKLICLSSIAQFLGAKSIKGHAVISDQQIRQKSISGNIKYKGIKLGVQAKNEIAKKYESKYYIEDNFGGEFSENSYQHAIDEAKVFGLDQDIEISNLLDQRNPRHSMHIVSRKLTIELSQELNKIFDTAFSACILGVCPRLNAGYKEILENRKTILFEMEIKF